MNRRSTAVPFWDSLEIDERRQLEGAGRSSTIERRTLLYSPGDPAESVYVVKSGLVRLVRSVQKGRELTLALCERGHLFGESPLFEEGPRNHYAEALLESEILEMPASKCRGLFHGSSGLAMKFTTAVWNRRADTDQRIEDVIFRDVPARLARSLLWLSEKYGETNSKGTVGIGLRLTHQELASIVGTTRETTTLVLNKFKRDGLIGSSGRSLYIKKPDTLRMVGDSPGRR
jgi:CRP/FNR family transcriptional regulator, cyclic AMP receptor protein